MNHKKERSLLTVQPHYIFRFMKGFGVLHLLETARAFPELFRPALQFSISSLTLEDMLSLVSKGGFRHSTAGSDRERQEVRRKAWFMNFLQDAAGNYAS